MGKETAISWTHHTFNPWWGCEKVSPACAHCYAETFAERFPASRGLWGRGGKRKFQSEHYWNDPIRWNKAAELAGERRRVFCASMADVFEDREELIPHRARLFDVIRRTPQLDWLLLTKRPEKWGDLIETARRDPSWANWYPHSDNLTYEMLTDWGFENKPPANVWLGATVENQEMAEKRIPALLSVPARVRFLSCEPLLGPVDLAYTCFNGADSFGQMPGIGWVICGGESGANARPMHPDWARALRDQCARGKVPFHFKQWGEWAPHDGSESPQYVGIGNIGRIRDESDDFSTAPMMKCGTKRAGRLLDGVLHDAFPNV